MECQWRKIFYVTADSLVQALQRTYCFQASPPDSRPLKISHVRSEVCNTKRSIITIQYSRNLGLTNSMKKEARITNLVTTERGPNLCTAGTHVDLGISKIEHPSYKLVFGGHSR
jgi:hypothetical protein